MKLHKLIKNLTYVFCNCGILLHELHHTVSQLHEKSTKKTFNKVTSRLSTHYKCHYFKGLLILPAGAFD